MLCGCPLSQIEFLPKVSALAISFTRVLGSVRDMIHCILLVAQYCAFLADFKTMLQKKSYFHVLLQNIIIYKVSPWHSSFFFTFTALIIRGFTMNN